MSDEAKQPLPPSEDAAPWWELALTRRDANRLGVAALVGAGLVTSAQLQGCCGSDEDEELEEIQDEDAIKLQREAGWDVGAESRTLALEGARDTDSKNTDGWKNYLKASALLEVIQPERPEWRSYQGNNLPQAVDLPTLRDQLKPVYTDAMGEAYYKGRSTASLVAASQDAEETLVLVDLPGPEAVAFAAGMADRVSPVFFFDNWPHPNGVVPSHQTLGALLYYGEELKAARAERKKAEGGVAQALILDSNRLAAYTDDAGLFDNRYLASPPDEDELKKLKVKRVLYVSAGSRDKELDDLNDTLVDYEEASIPVQMVSTRAFAKDAKDPDPERRTGGYYYGGSHHHHTYFYTHYPMFIWFHTGGYYSSWNRTPAPPPSTIASRSTYKPERRKTIFSGYKGGSATGRPTGFGRVYSRRSSSGGVTWSKSSSSSSRSSGSGSSSRSGSWGRSRSSGGSSG